jgi:hypothetical protein
VLPLIDLLILSGWTSLMIGAALKLIAMATRYRPGILGLTSLDFAVIAAVCFGFALTLAARTWVKLNEPRLLAAQRRAVHFEGVRRAREVEQAFEARGHGASGRGETVEDEIDPPAEVASAERR